MSKRLTKIVTFRVPVETEDRWKKISKGKEISLADWIRGQINDDYSPPIITNKPTPKKIKRRKVLDDPLAISISKFGANLNQIARWANTYKSNAEAVQVLSYLKTIYGLLGELRQGQIDKQEVTDDAH